MNSDGSQLEAQTERLPGPNSSHDCKDVVICDMKIGLFFTRPFRDFWSDHMSASIGKTFKTV
jgi:hypothetical protein